MYELVNEGFSVIFAITILAIFEIGSMNGMRYTKELFKHCDYAMLSYRSYRRKKVIKSMLKERIYSLIKMNIIPTSILIIGLPIIYKISINSNFVLNYFIISITVLVVSIYVSTHRIVAYYLMQPYAYSKVSKRVLDNRPIMQFIDEFVHIIIFFVLITSNMPILELCLGIIGYIIVYMFIASKKIDRDVQKKFRLL